MSEPATTCYDLRLWRLQIEERLRSLLDGPVAPYQSLLDAAAYTLFSAGKRVRPLLTLATCQALQTDPLLALDPACAVEMIHTYSLIHDDLPCMDDDDYRRGKPSLHKATNEALALLAGDFLLTRAFQVVAETPKASAAQVRALVRILSRRSGAAGMIGGQVLDVEADGSSSSEPSLRIMHRLKTGALITCCLELGAVIARADRPTRQLLRRFGRNIGLAYQIADDILDVEGGGIGKGRTPLSDEKNGKATYATLYGVEEAKRQVEMLLQAAARLLDGAVAQPAPLLEVASQIVRRS